MRTCPPGNPCRLYPSRHRWRLPRPVTHKITRSRSTLCWDARCACNAPTTGPPYIARTAHALYVRIPPTPHPSEVDRRGIAQPHISHTRLLLARETRLSTCREHNPHSLLPRRQRLPAWPFRRGRDCSCWHQHLSPRRYHLFRSSRPPRSDDATKRPEASGTCSGGGSGGGSSRSNYARQAWHIYQYACMIVYDPPLTACLLSHLKTAHNANPDRCSRGSTSSRACRSVGERQEDHRRTSSTEAGENQTKSNIPRHETQHALQQDTRFEVHSVQD